MSILAITSTCISLTYLVQCGSAPANLCGCELLVQLTRACALCHISGLFLHEMLTRIDTYSSVLSPHSLSTTYISSYGPLIHITLSGATDNYRVCNSALEPSKLN